MNKPIETDAARLYNKLVELILAESSNSQHAWRVAYVATEALRLVVQRRLATQGIPTDDVYELAAELAEKAVGNGVV